MNKNQIYFFEEAYSYAYIKLTAEGKELKTVPDGYGRESPLKPSYYTYKIGIGDPFSSNLFLKFELKKD